MIEVDEPGVSPKAPVLKDSEDSGDSKIIPTKYLIAVLVALFTAALLIVGILGIAYISVSNHLKNFNSQVYDRPAQSDNITLIAKEILLELQEMLNKTIDLEYQVQDIFTETENNISDSYKYPMSNVSENYLEKSMKSLDSRGKQARNYTQMLKEYCPEEQEYSLDDDKSKLEGLKSRSNQLTLGKSYVENVIGPLTRVSVDRLLPQGIVVFKHDKKDLPTEVNMRWDKITELDEYYPQIRNSGDLFKPEKNTIDTITSNFTISLQKVAPDDPDSIKIATSKPERKIKTDPIIPNKDPEFNLQPKTVKLELYRRK